MALNEINISLPQLALGVNLQHLYEALTGFLNKAEAEVLGLQHLNTAVEVVEDLVVVPNYLLLLILDQLAKLTEQKMEDICDYL